MALDKFRETVITWDTANRKVYQPLRVSGSDEKGRKLIVQVVNDGVIEDLTGVSLALAWRTRKNVTGLDPFTAKNPKEGIFELFYTNKMLQNVGVLKGNLVLVDATGRIVSDDFNITVFDKIDDSAAGSKAELSLLQQALTKVNQYDSTISKVSSEVESARGTHGNLSQRLFSTDRQLSETNQGLNERIDNIIAPNPTSISEQEIIDARQGSVSLGANLSSIKKSVDLPVVNLFKNGDFSKGLESWGRYASEHSVVEGIYKNVTNGTAAFSSALQTNDIPLVKDSVIYIEARVKVMHEGCKALEIKTRGTVNIGTTVTVYAENNPISDQWYTLKGWFKITNQTGFLNLFINQVYETSIAGKEMQIDYVTGFNVSNILGVGNEPTLSSIETFLSTRADRHFEKANFFTAKGIVEETKKNENKIGLMEELKTTDKKDLVSAINELKNSKEQQGIRTSELDWQQDIINLFDNRTLKKGRLKTDGSVDGNVDAETTDFIPIKPNTDYIFYLSHGIVSVPFVAYYDREKVFISDVKGQVPASYHRIVKSPPNAFFMKYSVWLHTVESDWREKAMVVEGIKYPAKYTPYLSSDNNTSGSITNSLISLTKEPNGEVPQFKTYDHLKYPLYPVWGHEYMYSWYEKLFNNEAIKMVWGGDSTTMEPTFWDGYNRADLTAKILRLGGYDGSKITNVRKGQGSSVAGSWIGYEGDIHYQFGGQLGMQMAENPDILFLGYGVNDARYNQTTLTTSERVTVFESKMREGLLRIRGNVAQPSGPAYNKSADELAIVLTTPITTAEKITVSSDWFIEVRYILQRLAREFHCGFVDVSARHYDHNFSNKWSNNQAPPYTPDSLHPSPVTNADWVSMMADLVFPLGLHKEKV